MFTRQAAHTVRLFLGALVLSLGVGWLTIQTLAQSPQKPRVVKSDERTAEDPGDTQKTTRQGWDTARDLPSPIASDGTVKYDYPIVYVRVPRPYPKTYYGINHLNQAGLHQTNAPGAELRLLHPDGRDESLVSVEAQESITDPWCRSTPSGSITPVPPHDHRRLGQHDHAAEPQGRGHLQGPCADAQGGAVDDARSARPTPERCRTEPSRTRAASTISPPVRLREARSSSSAIATAIAASANKPSLPCSSSSWTMTAGMSSRSVL